MFTQRFEHPETESKTSGRVSDRVQIPREPDGDALVTPGVGSQETLTPTGKIVFSSEHGQSASMPAPGKESDLAPVREKVAEVESGEPAATGGNAADEVVNQELSAVAAPESGPELTGLWLLGLALGLALIISAIAFRTRTGSTP